MYSTHGAVEFAKFSNEWDANGRVRFEIKPSDGGRFSCVRARETWLKSYDFAGTREITARTVVPPSRRLSGVRIRRFVFLERVDRTVGWVVVRQVSPWVYITKCVLTHDTDDSTYRRRRTNTNTESIRHERFDKYTNDYNV